MILLNAKPNTLFNTFLLEQFNEDLTSLESENSRYTLAKIIIQ